MPQWDDEPAPIRDLLKEGVDTENDLDTETRLERLEAAFIAHYHGEAAAADGGETATEQDVADLRDDHEDLKARVQQLAGLAEGQQSTPVKRAIDTCIGLQNLADANGGRAQWTYSEIGDHLEANGHGTVHPPQCYTVMDDLDEIDGFAKTTTDDGTQVLRCKSDSITVDGAVNEINKAHGESHPSNTPESEVNTAGAD